MYYVQYVYMYLCCAVMLSYNEWNDCPPAAGIVFELPFVPLVMLLMCE